MDGNLAASTHLEAQRFSCGDVVSAVHKRGETRSLRGDTAKQTSSHYVHLEHNEPLSTPSLDDALPLKKLDELCGVCSKIPFEKFYGVRCQDCSKHYHLGSYENIQSRKTCPFCRMLVSVHDISKLEPHREGSLMCVIAKSMSGGIKVWFVMEDSNWTGSYGGCLHVIRPCIDKPADEKPFHDCTKCDRRLYGCLIESQQVNFNLLRSWLHLCETQHGDTCSRPTLISKTAGRKIRLINVSKRNIVDGTTCERYLALSYTWGTGTQLSLEKSNVELLRTPNSLKDEDMTRTIKDAFEAVAKMGERYLWIDRLCILQDDEQDKLEQMSNMDQIYNAAVLTIVTSSECHVSGSNACVPGVNPDTRQLLQKSEMIQGVRFVTTQTDLVSAVRNLNWSSRGWTYQEGFLSRRCLVFTPYQTYFQCKSNIMSEDSCWVGEKRPGPKPPAGNALCQVRDYPDNLFRCNFNQYIDAVEGYSNRELTHQEDALWAFTGVTKAFRQQFETGFVWGLPLDNLDAALLWYPSRLLAGPRNILHAAIVGHHTIRLPFPTWSWTSCRDGVVYDIKCEDQVKSLVNWHKLACYAVNPLNPSLSPWRQVGGQVVLGTAGAQYSIHSQEAMMDEQALGYLRFTASTAYFTLAVQDSPYNHVVCKDWSLCHILGKTTKPIWVLKTWFDTHKDNQVEFILLSMCFEAAPDDETCQLIVSDGPNRRKRIMNKHGEGCKHKVRYNIMLIDWKEGPHYSVASRIGITQILKEDWEEAESKQKLIVLG